MSKKQTGIYKTLAGQAESTVARVGDGVELALCCDGHVVAGIVMPPSSARDLAKHLVEFANEIEGVEYCGRATCQHGIEDHSLFNGCKHKGCRCAQFFRTGVM